MSLSGEGLVVCLLSHVAEVPVTLAVASIWLKVTSPIGCDPHFVAQLPCQVPWLDIILSGPIFPCPSGEDVIAEVFGGG